VNNNSRIIPQLVIYEALILTYEKTKCCSIRYFCGILPLKKTLSNSFLVAESEPK
jgi:hypothetical protein